jgi:starch phosphorylase
MKKIAYFCMEYALENDFRQYAGGLGILAGDTLKGAKDMGFPMVGVGLLWKQGYTDQYIGSDGKPFDCYHNHTYDCLTDTGVTVKVKIRERDVLCKVWKTNAFGNVDLYLLDTDIEENVDAWITGQLYGWFPEERLAQEMVLGIGGVRALQALNINVSCYHFNEGHAVFAGLELLQQEMAKGLSFLKALEKTRTSIVFTTHTPIIQGNESHPISSLEYMGVKGKLTIEQLVHLGGAPFNMTVAGLKLSKGANGVSRLHAVTADKMWAAVEKNYDIIPVTNGIHIPTWVDPEILESANNPMVLWDVHMKNKDFLIDFVRARSGVCLNRDKLLIGFSRRAAPYKRSDLIFLNEHLIAPYLEQGEIQIVFSGKAHPLDDTGKDIVRRLVKMMVKYPDSVVFLENYDMEIGKALTTGSDLWLNNPIRPKEACGTSGMKAAMNGVLNLSILDGWWDEACQHGINGWAIGDDTTFEDEEMQNNYDSKSLYHILFDKVLPVYYQDRKKWIAMMAESIKSTQKTYDIKEMIRTYNEKLYII